MWGRRVVQGTEVVGKMEVEWVMEVSQVMEVEGVVGVLRKGDELVRTEVQPHAFLLYVCRRTIRHQSEKPRLKEASNIT